MKKSALIGLRLLTVSAVIENVAQNDLTEGPTKNGIALSAIPHTERRTRRKLASQFRDHIVVVVITRIIIIEKITRVSSSIRLG